MSEWSQLGQVDELAIAAEDASDRRYLWMQRIRLVLVGIGFVALLSGVVKESNDVKQAAVAEVQAGDTMEAHDDTEYDPGAGIALAGLGLVVGTGAASAAVVGAIEHERQINRDTAG